MQISYQTQAPEIKGQLGVTTPAMIPNGSRGTGSQQLHNHFYKTSKSENENYKFSRIHSPYLSPSNAIVSNKATAAKTLEPTYVHNTARTKYFFISKPARSMDHLKVNLLA